MSIMDLLAVTETPSTQLIPVIGNPENNSTPPELREELGIIHQMVADYQSERRELDELYSQFKSVRTRDLFNYLTGFNSCISERYLQGAHNVLRSGYWQRVMNRTNVLSIMDTASRDKWAKQFTFYREDMYRDDKQDVPDFTVEAIVPTVIGLLNDRNQFLQARVVGVFKRLSINHKTNKRFGFSSRMIITGVQDYSRSSNGKMVAMYNRGNIEPLSELREILGFFEHRTIENIYRTDGLVEECVCRAGFGQWVNIDGNGIRFRVYKNGNMHIEVHPSMAEKMNAILAAMMPLALPSEIRTQQAKIVREFPTLRTTLAFSTRNILADMKFRQTGAVWSHHMSGQLFSCVQSTHEDVARTLQFIGARISGYSAELDYCPRDVLHYLAAVGSVADRVAYQFYPTPDPISEYAASLLGAGDGDTLLEPHAGQGGLLTYVPDSVKVKCVELDTLNCLILRAKGYDVEEADFIAWSRSNPDQLFSCILMNPPYSLGRDRLHLETAARHLAPGGRMVAVLWLSLVNEEQLLGDQYDIQWLQQYDNEFDDTCISVRVLYVERKY